MAFASTEELFAAVRGLIAGLEARGEQDAARTLKEGFSALNGLADGWGLFDEALAAVELDGARLTPGELKTVGELRDGVGRALRRWC